MACLAAAACAGGDIQNQTLEQLAAAGDSLGLGRRIRWECRRSEAREACFQERFVALARGGRVRLALGALGALARIEEPVAANAHVYAHLIGISSWPAGTDIARTFAQCTALYQSGCYHGVIQSYLTDGGGIDSARVAELCDLVERESPGGVLRFQCAHGLGHGLSMALGWELLNALEHCDWLAPPDRAACYGGAFMENVVAGEARHAPADLLASRDAAPATGGQAPGGAHAHHGPDPSAIPFKLRDTTDLLYPCSVVRHRYQPACYILQGGLILRLVGFDFARAAAGCDLAPEALRHLCYLSLGTSIAGFTVQDARRSARLCTYGDPGYQPWCFVGVAKNFVELRGKPEDGIAFCRVVPAGDNRRQCFVALGEHFAGMFPGDTALRSASCALSPAADREDCRYGAALLNRVPPGLPILPPALKRPQTP